MWVAGYGEIGIGRVMLYDMQKEKFLHSTVLLKSWYMGKLRGLVRTPSPDVTIICLRSMLGRKDMYKIGTNLIFVRHGVSSPLEEANPNENRSCSSNNR